MTFYRFSNSPWKGSFGESLVTCWTWWCWKENVGPCHLHRNRSQPLQLIRFQHHWEISRQEWPTNDASHGSQGTVFCVFPYKAGSVHHIFCGTNRELSCMSSVPRNVGTNHMREKLPKVRRTANPIWNSLLAFEFPKPLVDSQCVHHCKGYNAPREITRSSHIFYIKFCASFVLPWIWKASHRKNSVLCLYVH